jgi:hypothetical protein
MKNQRITRQRYRCQSHLDLIILSTQATFRHSNNECRASSPCCIPTLCITSTFRSNECPSFLRAFFNFPFLQPSFDDFYDFPRATLALYPSRGILRSALSEVFHSLFIIYDGLEQLVCACRAPRGRLSTAHWSVIRKDWSGHSYEYNFCAIGFGLIIVFFASCQQGTIHDLWR